MLLLLLLLPHSLPVERVLVSKSPLLVITARTHVRLSQVSMQQTGRGVKHERGVYLRVSSSRCHILAAPSIMSGVGFMKG